MTARFRLAGSAALVSTALVAACATARNFDDASGPRFVAAYARDARPVPDGQPLRVVTFNIRYAIEIDRALGLIASSPDLHAPDLLLLQEMDSAGVQRMAEALAMNAVYFPGAIHPRSKKETGAAILSPWPLDDAGKLVLPHPAFITNARRVATSAVMRRGALRVRVVSVHLPAPGSVTYDERHEQVQRLVDAFGHSAEPVVLGGDFNSRAVGAWLRNGGFAWLTESLPGTSRGMGRWWSYDHVFVRGLSRAEDGASAGTVDSAGASDHRAVWVRVVARSS